MASLISLLTFVIVACFVIWLAMMVLDAFKTPDPFRTLIIVVLALGILGLFLNGSPVFHWPY